MYFVLLVQSNGVLSGAELTLGRVSSREVRWPRVTYGTGTSQVSQYTVKLVISLTLKSSFKRLLS